MVNRPTRQAYFDFGHEHIGPIISQYCHLLNSILEQSGISNILFCARAGLRIASCLQSWLLANSIEPSYNIKIIPLSRIAALRLSSASTPADLEFIEEAMRLNTNLYGLESVNKFLGSNILSSDIPEGVSSFGEIINYVKSHHLCDEEFDSIEFSKSDFNTLLRDLGLNRRCMIVDTGWAGSTQLFLENAYPEITFSGIYLATSDKINVLGKVPGNMFGVLHDFLGTNPLDVGKNLIHHRHFFESLFEPNISSFGLFSMYDFNRLNSSGCEKLDVASDWDHVYLGALNFVSQYFHDQDSMYDKFLNESKFISNQFIQPSCLLNVFCLGGKARSHDMGREGCVEVFDINEIKGKLNKKNHEFNLWPEGTSYIVSYLYNKEVKEPRFEMVSSSNSKSTESVDIRGNHPLVSVITRTKNRPVLLRRAIKSVAKQDYKYIEHIIVNDGGNPLQVENEILSSESQCSTLKVLHNSTSIGMEAASNAGIKVSTGEYLLIHDDDDSLSPSFVSECIDYLKFNSYCEGVVTRSTYVSEQIHGNSVQILAEHPYNSWLEYIMMSEMAINNIFPPISFLFSRKMYNQIGGFNETLPVLGDWDFNLKFLALSDIGVIPKELAYYHHRDQGNTSSSYSNSVIGGIDKHKKFRPVMINGLLRTQSPEFAGLRSCIATAYSTLEVRSFTRK